MGNEVLPLAVAVTLCGAALPSHGEGSLLKSEYIKTSGEAELGKWYGYRQFQEGPGDFAFTNALARARAAHVPMFTFWGNPECEWCSLATEEFNKEEFQSYISSKNVLFAHFKGGSEESAYYPSDLATRQAYDYILELGQPWSWPYYRFEWVKPDGTVVTWNGSMCDTLYTVYTAEKFRILLEGLLDGYDNMGELDYFGGDIAISDSAGSRLEVEAGRASTVWVPFSRRAEPVATNQIVKCCWNGITNEYALVWEEGVANKFVAVEVPDGPAAGDEVILRVEDSRGHLDRVGRIHVVAPQATSQENPAWIGAKAADELEWGEWTMDIAVATQKVAAAAAAGTNAYTLVLVGGELWCPDCDGMRANLLSKAEFMDWAKSNNVALVLIDIPRSFDTAVPTMLSWGEFASSGKIVSGAAYLSRNGISPEAAAGICERNRLLCRETFNPPYENRARPWVPTLFIMSADGRICGKILGDRKYPNGTTFTVETYMRRFNEMLAMTGDAGEWDNNDWTTTKEAFPAKGGVWNGMLCALDGNTGNEVNQKVIDVAEIAGFGRDEELVLTFSGECEARVRPSLVYVSEDDGGNVVTEFAGPSFKLSSGSTWTLTNSVPFAKRVFLAVKGDDSAFFAYSNVNSTVCSYSVASAAALTCGESVAQKAVAAGKMDIKIEKGLCYMLMGVETTVTCSNEDFAKIDDNFYRALRSGTATIAISDAGNLVYQVWNPGSVSFAAGELSVSERDGTAKVELKRVGGVSGQAKVRVRHIGGTASSIADDAENGRFEWPGDAVLTWPDGVNTNQTLTIKVFNRSPRWDGDQTVVLSLEPEPDSSVDVSLPQTCTLTIVEADAKSTGMLELVPDASRFSRKGVAYARKGDVVAFDVARVGGASSTVSATIEVDGGGIVSPMSAEWAGNSADVSKSFTLSIPAGADPGTWIMAKVVPYGICMKGGVDRLYVQVIDDALPSFSEDSIEATFCRSVASNVCVDIVGTGFSSFRAEKLSGSLPKGVVATVDGAELRFAGAPINEGTFNSTWRVIGVKADGSEIEGATVPAVFTVVEASSVCAAAGDKGFPSSRAEQYCGYAMDGAGGLVCAALLSASGDGSMRLVVNGSWGNRVLESSNWSSIDGDAVCAKLAGDGFHAIIRWHGRPDGSCGFGGTLCVDGKSVESDVELRFYPKNASGDGPDPGMYFVDFEPEGTEPGTGHAFVSIRVSAGALEGIKASYSGMTPDGRTFCGSCPVIPFDGYSLLPLVARSSSGGGVRSLLKVVHGAAGDERFSGEESYNHSVSNASVSFWDVPGGEMALPMCGQGGYYRPGMNLEAVSMMSDLTTDYKMEVSVDRLYDMYGLRPEDGAFSGVVSVKGDGVRLRDASSRTTFSFSRATGMFSGKFTAIDDSGRRIRVGFRGIVTPNWGEACPSGCGRGPRPGPFKPFGVGTSYVNVRKSIPGVLFKLSPIQKE